MPLDAGKIADAAAEAVGPLLRQQRRQIEALEARLATIEARAAVPGPQGEPGEPGPQGEPGPPGRDVDLEELEVRIAPEIRRAVEALIEPGPQGEKGDPGRDADPSEVAPLVVPLAVPLVLEQIPTPEPGAPGERGEKGEPGEPGPAGRDADPADVVPLVLEQMPPPEPGARGERGERGEKGDPGEPGPAGRDADPAEVVPLVLERLPEPEPGPRGERGEPGPAGKDADPADVVPLVLELLPPPEKGERGEAGPQGERGERGERGADGVGVAGALVDRAGSLVLTMQDGSTRDLGVVVGKDGERGEPGRDGQDGVGFDDLEVTHDGRRGFTFRFQKGERVREFAFSVPVLLDAGVYREGQSYDAGDCVSFGGSMWAAQKATAEKPGDGQSWRLAVKHGRDGRTPDLDAFVKRSVPAIVKEIVPSVRSLVAKEMEKRNG